MATAMHNLSDYDFTKVPDASNMIFGVVVAEWNPEITGALLEGCVSTLERHGALPENIHVKTVPGSFELIYGAHQMTLNDGYDAVIILGSVIRGETPHFDYICQGVTEGIARLNATSNIPVVYGLLTTNDLQQAKDRAGGKLGNKGDECAVVAIKMAKFYEIRFLECEWPAGLRRTWLQRHLPSVGCRFLLLAGNEDAGRAARLAV